MKTERQVLSSLYSHPAIKVVRQLASKEAVRAYLAGGSIRDLFLGLPPRHFHFAVDCDPAEPARKLAELTPGRVSTSDSKYGGIARYQGKHGRLDFGDCRALGPAQYVRQRFGFTVDSIIYDVSDGRFVDSASAMSDLQNKLIRLDSPIDSRGQNGHFLLRAVRLSLFSPEFRIVPETRDALASNRAAIVKANPADIGYELCGIVESSLFREGIRLLTSLGALDEIFRGFLHADDDVCDCSSTAEEVLRVSGALENLIRAFGKRIKVLGDRPEKELPLLRLALLVSHELRRRPLSPAELTPFLINRGQHIEDRLINLGILQVDAFKARILAVCYVLGMNSLLNKNSDLSKAIDRSIAAFGELKGTLGSFLISADWSTNPSIHRRGEDGIEEAHETLTNLLSQSTGRGPGRKRAWFLSPGRRTANDQGLFSYQVSADRRRG